jgi:hypothetical protein
MTAREIDSDYEAWLDLMADDLANDESYAVWCAETEHRAANPPTPAQYTDAEIIEFAKARAAGLVPF